MNPITVPIHKERVSQLFLRLSKLTADPIIKQRIGNLYRFFWASVLVYVEPGTFQTLVIFEFDRWNEKSLRLLSVGVDSREQTPRGYCI